MALAGCSFPDHEFLPIGQFNRLKDGGASGGFAGVGGFATGGSGGVAGSGGSGAVGGGGAVGVGGRGAGGDAGNDAPTGGSGGGGTGGNGATGDVDGGAGMGGGGDAGPCTGPVVINEVSTTGTSSSDEYVELFNAGICTVNLSGWRLHYSASSGGNNPTYWTGTASDQLPAKAYYVLAGSGFQGAHNGLLSGGLAKDGGGIGLFNDLGTRVDSMAWASVVTTHPYIEGTACANILTGSSASRIPDGKDTNDNSKDFTVPAKRTPGAKNSG